MKRFFTWDYKFKLQRVIPDGYRCVQQNLSMYQPKHMAYYANKKLAQQFLFHL